MVGNSLSSHAEMSADIASVPPWKMALLERRRLHDKEPSASTNVSHTPSGPPSDHHAVCDSNVPAWKRDILARKQNQKNSVVSAAKPGQTDIGQVNDNASSLNGSCTIPGVDAALVDIDINDTAEDNPVEERLLPIHHNPILRLDWKKRHQSSSGSARSSMSPRADSPCGDGHEHSSTVSPVSSQAPVTPDAVNEVFVNDSDCGTEVAYGKGFVHKLLMKFSYLSGGSSDQTANNRCSKQRFSSLPDNSSVSATSPRGKLSQDLESLPSKPSSAMPTTKFHSVDDLLHETRFQVHVDDGDSADELDFTATNHVNGECSVQLDHHTGTAKNEGEVPSNGHSNCAQVSDNLPFANIVSNARSLFEGLAVHSASQKHSVSTSTPNTASSHVSYISTYERSQRPKTAPVSKRFAQVKKFDGKKFDKSVKLTAEVLQTNGTASDTCAEEPQKDADARTESNTNKSVQESGDGEINCSVVGSSPSVSRTRGTYDKVSNRDVNISATGATLTQPASTHADLSTTNNNVLPVKSPSTVDAITSDRQSETVSVASVTQSKTTTNESHPYTKNTKSWTEENISASITKPIRIDSSLSSQPVDNKENVKSQPASSGKKPAPPRPGKLVIRPASNLVAAKTSSEYLELTKFNDVRKGEFAPPLKKERIDPDAYDDDIDKVDGVAEDYVFDGAGLIIGRSLLTKTNKNKSVYT